MALRSLRPFAALLSLVVVTLPAMAAPRRTPVLMISIDGLRPDDVLHARERGMDLPNLRALVDGGTYASGVRGVLPSVTYPSHTTLVTGVAPAVHGIASNLRFDPLGHNYDGWYWYSAAIRTDTLWSAVKATGGRTASIGWPVTVGQSAIDANIPEYWRARTPDDLLLLRALSTPGIVDAAERASGAQLDMGNTDPAQDAEKAKAAAWMSAAKPQFFTIHLSSLDHQEHVYGPDSAESKAALTQIDADVGTIVTAARAAQTDLIVAIVSDHGFAPVSHDIALAAAFEHAGLIRYDAQGKVAGWDAMPWPAGGSAAVVLARRNDPALRARVAELLASLARDPASGIDAVLDRAAVKERGGADDADFFVDARIGYQFTARETGPLVTPGTSRGTHGYFLDHPEMRSTFIVNGPGIAHNRNVGEIDMRDIATTIAHLLGVTLRHAPGRVLPVAVSK